MNELRVIDPINPTEVVEEGSTWEWLSDVSCRSGIIQTKGSLAHVIEKTGMTPYREIMSRGYNLLVHTGGSTTVWSTFEQCISRGLLRRVK